MSSQFLAGALAVEHVAAQQATGMSALMWLVIALPLLGAALLLVGGRKTDSFGPALATGLSWAAFGVGVATLFQLLGMAPESRIHHLPLWSWLAAGPFHLDVGLLVDPLSLSFVMLVTFVGSLIHVYSLGYMAHDPDKRRFFAYLNLFVAAMLTLVLADSYLLLYVGWEGVGLASYLLIGFWNWNPPYARAANKAFIINRIGDFGLGVAIMLMFATMGTVTYAGVAERIGGVSPALVTALGLFLLLAACGKSAQFPLQSWLGDAMAGPTPVSALIHAATMVTAGVYLVVRSNPVFNLTPTAQLAVSIVGVITLTMGAIIGCAKDDIKKALAASTMSQIGYMMLAAGLGPIGYAVAIFHLITHGFFKAGMFLGAGSVMHGMNNRVDMRTFGALSTKMKITWITFGLGWMAIIGVPFLSGWFSKDAIIEAAFVGEGWRPWVFGGMTLLVAGLTAYYMSRLFFMTFHGKARWETTDHPHESPATMTIPMVILAVGSLGLGAFLNFVGFTSWLSPVTGHVEHHHEPVISVPMIQILAFVLMALGVLLAWMQYARKDVPLVAGEGSFLTRMVRKDFFQDDINEGIFMGPTMGLTRLAADDAVVDDAVVGVGRGVAGLSGVMRLIQNGLVRTYAMTMLTGIVLLFALVWMVQ